MTPMFCFDSGINQRRLIVKLLIFDFAYPSKTRPKTNPYTVPRSMGTLRMTDNKDLIQLGAAAVNDGQECLGHCKMLLSNNSAPSIRGEGLDCAGLLQPLLQTNLCAPPL